LTCLGCRFCLAGWAGLAGKNKEGASRFAAESPNANEIAGLAKCTQSRGATVSRAAGFIAENPHRKRTPNFMNSTQFFREMISQISRYDATIACKQYRAEGDI
jgi:hypothetical protein